MNCHILHFIALPFFDFQLLRFYILQFCGLLRLLSENHLYHLKMEIFDESHFEPLRKW